MRIYHCTRSFLSSSPRLFHSSFTSSSCCPSRMQQSPKRTGLKPLSETQAKWLQLQSIEYTDQAGTSRLWEMVQRTTRKGDCDAACIFPILKSQSNPPSTILITQYRPPVDGHVVELPAGLIDQGETVEQAAIRELKEETGYTGIIKETTMLMVNDPGISNETMKLVTMEIDLDLPENQHPKAQLDEGEYIVCHRVPIKGLLQTLEDKFTSSHSFLHFKQQGYHIDSRLHHLAHGLALSCLLE